MNSDPSTSDDPPAARRRGPSLEWHWALLIVLVGTVAMGLAIRSLLP